MKIIKPKVYRGVVSDLINDYKETDSGRYLKKVLDEQIKNNLLTEVNADKVFCQAAKEYDRYINNPKNAWVSVKMYLKQCPDIFSLLDIIDCEVPVTKYFYIVSMHNSHEVAEIFNVHKRSFKKYETTINGNDLCIFVSIVKYSRKEDKNGPIGNDIFTEIEKKKISVGYHYYSLDSSDTSNFISLFPVRDLDITKKIRISSSGFRSDLGFGFRSSWEANLARILNYFHLSWEYETKSFLVKDERFHGYYFPDFILSNNIVIEVKGFWDNESREKVRLFDNQYPEYHLICIDKDLFYDLDKKYKKLISNWEEIDCRISQETVQVVGINQAERKANVKALSIGNHLIIKRDPRNKYDSHAIKVYSGNNEEIGYISKDWAFIYSQNIDLGIKYTAVIKEVKQNVLEVLINRTNLEDEIIHDIFSIPLVGI